VDIGKILVVGAGQMGSGIAQVAAQSGIDVVLSDLSLKESQKGLAGITKNLERLVAKGRITREDRDQALGRITCAEGLSVGSAADMVIEAVVEEVDVKRALFNELGATCPEDVIFASNTSSISITRLGRASGRPDRFAGMHFMNPVPVMQLVEVIRGLETSDDTVAAVTSLAQRLGKQPVVMSDSSGFVVNRLAIPMINEAVYCLSEGVADAESIDTCARLGLNHPMGPLALADLIGLDTVVSILEVLAAETGDPKYRPCPLLRRMVDAGRLGRKSGRGFYSYSE
jgi:3-hydroxybutyryl-CoA dehydrogenase